MVWSVLRMEHIFRAYDIRGIWGKDLDASTCLDIGRGLGAFLSRDLSFGKVCIGRDVRTSSEAFHGALVSGLLSSGIDVLSVGRCGFGVALLAGSKEGCDASCYITASHLPPEWNGLKVYFGDGVGFPEEHIKAVGKRVMDKDFSEMPHDKMGSYSEQDYLDRYVAFWRSKYSGQIKRKGLSIALDCGGGAMCLSAPKVIESLGVDMDLINGEPDPLFSKRPSEPKPENLGQLRDEVMTKGSDLGVAFDGDGDRAVVVDDKGRFLSTDRVGILIAKTLVEEAGGGLVLANVESSMAVEDVLRPLGANVRRIKVGHTFLTLEAKEQGALFGVERSGHLIVPKHVLFDDAILAPLELLRMLAYEGRPLSEMADRVPQYPSASDAYDCADSIKFRVVAELTDDLKRKHDHVNTQDGVRVDTDRGWALIRCSNTSPVIRLTVEARDEDDLSALRERYGKTLREAIERHQRGASRG